MPSTFVKRPTSIAAKRLVRKAYAAKTAQREFVSQISAIKPTEARNQRAGELAQRTRDAKTAPFLDKYRATAKS